MLRLFFHRFGETTLSLFLSLFLVIVDESFCGGKYWVTFGSIMYYDRMELFSSSYVISMWEDSVLKIKNASSKVSIRLANLLHTIQWNVRPTVLSRCKDK